MKQTGARMAQAGFQGFVVAIGASAGGLVALRSFFRDCPAGSGAAFVVILHQGANHKSMIHELLARDTAMPVRLAEEGAALKPDTVFLIPPGMLMRLAGGRLRLTPRPPEPLTLPIDIFLNSLADQAGQRAIAVILSGAGSDGSRGARAINAAGGLLIAQDPQQARFDGMPDSAIRSGLVDVVLRAEEMGAFLRAHLQNR